MLAISRNRWVNARLTGWIARLLSRCTSFDARDYARLLNFADGYAVVELQVREGDWVAGRTLEELDIRAEGAALLGITRTDRDTHIGVPIRKTRLRPGDTLVLYGRSAHLVGVVPSDVVRSRGGWLFAEGVVWSCVVVAFEVGG